MQAAWWKLYPMAMVIALSVVLDLVSDFGHLYDDPIFFSRLRQVVVYNVLVILKNIR